jgi:hypothetical protein
MYRCGQFLFYNPTDPDRCLLADRIDRSLKLTNMNNMSHQQIAAKFNNRIDAEAAYQALTETETLSSETVSLDVAETAEEPTFQPQTQRSVKGGAIAGAVFGAIAGLLLSIAPTLNQSGPQVSHVSLQFAALVAAGGAFSGAIAFGLIAGVTSNYIPEDPQSNPTSSKEAGERTVDRYSITVSGNDDELDRARQILTQQGAEIA